MLLRNVLSIGTPNAKSPDETSTGSGNKSNNRSNDLGWDFHPNEKYNKKRRE